MSKISVIGICGESLFFSPDSLPSPGETVHSKSLHIEYGGKGINQAIAARRMGCEVSFLCAVGDDEAGKMSMEFAKENGIKGRFAVKCGEKTAKAAILTDKKGENEVIVFGGAVLNEEDINGFDDEIAKSDILLLQNEIPEKLNIVAASIAEKHKVRVILNPAPERSVSKSLALKTYLVTPNEHEESALNKLDFKNIITTCGAKGCIINSDKFIPAIKTSAVDTTGAGDTFSGVIAAALSEGLSLCDAAKYAIAASGISVGKKGVINSIPYRDEIERMINNE